MTILDNALIIAFDILPMSSTERQKGVRVAASAKLENGVTKEWSQISRKKLLRLVSKYNFDYIGTDNPAEIIRENETVAGFCDLLPTTCSLVHVNLTRSGGTISVRSLLDQYNLNPTGKKLSPVKTARALLQLMEQGVGMILEPYENETLIRIGKPSGSSKGGWSQARYQRQAEEVVGRETQKLKELLSTAGLQFDEITYSTKYGAKMSRFHIFNSKPKVIEALGNHSFYPAKLKIWSPKKSLVTHKPLAPLSDISIFTSDTQNRRVIVGIDPGMTTGVAIMSLSGKVISVFSRKNLSKGQMITEISKFGIPVLICADVSPIPTFVNKIAVTYNSPIMSPEIILRKEEKRHLSNGLGYKQRIDSHERDALAAVAYAYKRLSGNFRKIEDEKLTRNETEIAKSLIIRGLSVKESIASAKQHKKSETEISTELRDYHVKDAELVGRIKNLQDKVQESEVIIGNLRAHAGRVEAQNTLLQNTMRRIENQYQELKDAQIRESLQLELIKDKERQVKILNKKYDLLLSQSEQKDWRIRDLEEMLWVTIDEGGLPVKILPKFSNDAIIQLNYEKELNPGDLVLILDPTGGGPQTAEKLVSTQPGFIFIENHNFPKQAFEVFYKAEIPVLRAEKYGIIRTNYLGIINQKNLLKAKEEYMKFVKQREEEKKTSKILQTIHDYQYERAKELKQNKKSYDDYELIEDDSKA